jgi:hypothetical protein
MICSRNPFSSAGIVPSHSGKMKTRCLGVANRLSHTLEICRNCLVLELVYRPQQRKIESREVNAADQMARGLGAFRVRVGKRAAQALWIAVRMTDDNDDAARHEDLSCLLSVLQIRITPDVLILLKGMPVRPTFDRRQRHVSM